MLATVKRVDTPQQAKPVAPTPNPYTIRAPTGPKNRERKKLEHAPTGPKNRERKKLEHAPTGPKKHTNSPKKIIAQKWFSNEVHKIEKKLRILENTQIEERDFNYKAGNTDQHAPAFWQDDLCFDVLCSDHVVLSWGRSLYLLYMQAYFAKNTAQRAEICTDDCGW